MGFDHARDRGSATTEAVLVTPILLFLIMVVIQFGLWYHAQHVVRAASEQGVRAARVDQAEADAGADRAERFLADAGPRLVTEPAITVDRTTDTVTVSVSGRVVAVVPGLELPVRATARGAVERFRAASEAP